MLVGVFLIFTAVHASLVRRRRDFGLLRSLGATRGQVLGAILAEVALLGILGTAVGIPLGWFAANANVEVVSATLSNLYLLEEIESLRFPSWMIVVAAVVGLGGAVGGAWMPAADISRRHPRALLAAAREGVRQLGSLPPGPFQLDERLEQGPAASAHEVRDLRDARRRGAGSRRLPALCVPRPGVARIAPIARHGKVGDGPAPHGSPESFRIQPHR